MNLPPLLSLRSFESVARRGSVRQAAEELCVSPSAVSHQIHKLEEWLGLPLIERSGRGIRLTEAGERYKSKVCEGLGIIESETALLRKHKGAPVVRAAVLSGFAVAWLMPQMQDFWVKYPDVQLAIYYSRLTDPLDPATVDIAVRYGHPGDFPEFVGLPLLEGLACPFAS